MKRQLEGEDENSSPTKQRPTSQFFTEAPKPTELEVILTQLLPIVQMWDAILLHTLKEFAEDGPDSPFIICSHLKHNIKVINQRYAKIAAVYSQIDLNDKIKEHIDNNPAAKNAYYVMSQMNRLHLDETLYNMMKTLGQGYLKDVLDILNNLYNTNAELLAQFTKIQAEIKELVCSKDTDDSDVNLNRIYLALRNFDVPLKEIKASQDKLIKDLKAKIKVVSPFVEKNAMAKFIYDGLRKRLDHLTESRDLVASSYIRCLEEIKEIKNSVANPANSVTINSRK